MRRNTLALVLCCVAAACGSSTKDDAASRAPASTAGVTEAQLMQEGTTLLYQKEDPLAAEAVFRRVLQLNPTHYGAHYQLAVSLDRGGKPRDARATWETVLRSAEDARDSATARTARLRLAGPDTASQTGMMALGIDLLYRQNQPAAAADQFRKVLERNPTHYGATFQLATALDRAGQQAQARRVWEKVLGMAVSYGDERTAETARTKLK